MNNFFNRTMKGSLLAACLLALCTTLSVAQVQRSVGKGKMVLVTAQGKAEYEHDMLSTIADLSAKRYTFYFKIPGFTSRDQAADKRLMQVLDAESYSLISFDGKFTEAVKRPAPGKTGTAHISGTLKYQGKQLKTDLTAITYLRDGKLVVEPTLVLDPKGTEAARTAATQLGVTQPVTLTINAAY